MHHRNIELGNQPTLDLKALRRLDILEVDSTKGRSNRFDSLNELIDINSVNLDIKHIDISECLEQQPLSFHHRFASKGTDITQAKNSGSIADDGHQITLRSVLVSVIGICRNFLTGIGNARRVSQGQFTSSSVRFCRFDADLPSRCSCMVIESFLAQTILIHAKPSRFFGPPPPL